MLRQYICLMFDRLIDPRRSGGIIFGDIVQLLKPGAGRGFEPANRQTAASSTAVDLLRQAARLIAL